ncbi:MAG: SH3 domain-containing protein [Pseudomonadota bacterium]
MVASFACYSSARHESIRRQLSSATFATLLPILIGGCSTEQVQTFSQSFQDQVGTAVATARDAVSRAAANNGILNAQAVVGRTSKTVNVRVGPTTDSQALGLAAAGRQLRIVGRQELWYQVAFDDGQQPAAGWISAELVELDVSDSAPQPGFVTDSINLREGPGGDRNVIGSLSAGDTLSIVKADQGWLKIKQGEKEGWASARYVVADLTAPPAPASPSTGLLASLTSGSNLPNAESSPSTKATDAAAVSSNEPSAFNLQPNQSIIETVGYTKAFAGVRSMTRTGAFELAVDEVEKLRHTPKRDDVEDEGEAKLVKASAGASSEAAGSGENITTIFSPDEMHLALERGTVLLTHGDVDGAIDAFAEAGDTLEERRQGTILEEKGAQVATALTGWLIGDGEIGPYPIQPYEEILLLNYKTLGHLLKGERKAFNVARRAADRQNELRDQFVDIIKSAPTETKDDELTGDDAQDVEIQALRGWLSSIAESYSGIGERVPSAYVNPFGFYVVGMVNEIESYADPARRDNARIAYEKALELNPESAVLQELVKAMKGGLSSNDRKVVHIVAGVGLAPEKQLATYGMPLVKLKTVMPLKFPIYKAVPDVVARIEVRDSTGLRKLGELSGLADIEAMALRYQKDRLPMETAEFIIGLVPRMIEKQGLSKFGMFGQLVGKWRDTTTNPDLRAWLSLPARIQAGRLVLPRGQKDVQLIAFDENGRELSRTQLNLPADNHGIAYVRAIDKFLQTQVSAAEWLETL